MAAWLVSLYACSCSAGCFGYQLRPPRLLNRLGGLLFLQLHR